MSRRTATADVFDQVCDTDDEQRPAPPVSHWQPDDENSATAADDSASEPDVTTPQATGARGRRVGLRTVVTGLLLALSLATSVVFVWQAHTRHQLDAAREQALQAAKDYAVVLTTLDVTNIDANYRDTLAGATGKFKDDYSQGSSQMRQILIDNHASGPEIEAARLERRERTCEFAVTPLKDPKAKEDAYVLIGRGWVTGVEPKPPTYEAWS